MCKYNIQPLTHTNPPFPTYGVCVCVSVLQGQMYLSLVTARTVDKINISAIQVENKKCQE